jgi:mRNA interferase MazF
MEVYNKFDVVKISFPFTDTDKYKMRPALVVSNNIYQSNTDHLILSMITSAKNSSWNNDIEITDYKSCGLPSPSIIRFKIFSLDCRLVISKLGNLDANTKIKFTEVFTNLLN